jgi:hypothetical protein
MKLFMNAQEKRNMQESLSIPKNWSSGHPSGSAPHTKAAAQSRHPAQRAQRQSLPTIPKPRSLLFKKYIVKSLIYLEIISSLFSLSVKRRKYLQAERNHCRVDRLSISLFTFNSEEANVQISSAF